ncbi:hypothetical protein FRB90_009238 [Tulasnella sp. 427]|nr:hypothetical protein FRB90_009238 [Tulasnella sp. 427]
MTEAVCQEPTTPSPEVSELPNSTLLVNGKSYKKHDVHWYDEGNLGFLVGSTAFRLHRSILSRRSQVMADMLSVPQPFCTVSENADPSGTGNVDNIPFVDLQDPVNDFTRVLDFIYPSSLPAARTDHLRARDLMGIVRLSGKYLIEDLREWAVGRLEADHLPQTSASDAIGGYMEASYDDPAFSVDVIQFSRECSAPQFLPIAFYALATTEWNKHPGKVKCLHKLSSKDQERVHEGRSALLEKLFTRKTVPDSLARRAGCKKTRAECQSLYWSDPSARLQGLILHPIEELETPVTFDSPSLCEECKSEIQDGMKKARDQLMSDLVRRGE